VNNDVARAAGLIAVAVLPALAGITGAAYLHPVEFSAGFHRAALICAGLCVLGGALSAAAIRNQRRAPGPAQVPAPAPVVPAARVHCGLDAPPVSTQDRPVPARRG